MDSSFGKAVLFGRSNGQILQFQRLKLLFDVTVELLANSGNSSVEELYPESYTPLFEFWSGVILRVL